MTLSSRSSVISPALGGLRRWALLTVCATFALLVLGSLVTTLRAGMADRDWPTSPLYLASKDVAAEAQKQGYATSLHVIEHTHRAAGYFVGCCAIVLCAWLWASEPRTWMKWLGTVALLGVIAQGVLGGMRVLLNDLLGTDLATMHGCLAQIVFAILVSIALFLSPWWQRGPARPDTSAWLRRLTLTTGILIYGQIILGAIVRHTHLRLAQRLHFLAAFLVVAAAIWIVAALREEGGDARLRTAARFLIGLVAFQVMLGVEAWMFQYGSGSALPPEARPVTVGSAIVRTLHFAVGSLVFSTSVVLALLARQRIAGHAAEPVPQRELVTEGVA